MSVISLHPDARQELREAVREYEEERIGLGAKLFAQVERRLVQASHFPVSGAPILGFDDKYDVRRFVVLGFSFILVTAVVKDQRLVVAFAHTRRSPGYWRSRIE